MMLILGKNLRVNVEDGLAPRKESPNHLNWHGFTKSSYIKLSQCG